MNYLIRCRINRRSYFVWDGDHPLLELIDLKNNRALIAFYHHPEENDGFDEVWARREDDGSITCSPNVLPDWRPLECNA